jgi:hypothetical protein
MSDALVQYARSRNPDGPSLERWSTFAKGSENRIDFGDQIAVKKALRQKQPDFLSGCNEAAHGRAREPQ